MKTVLLLAGLGLLAACRPRPESRSCDVYAWQPWDADNRKGPFVGREALDTTAAALALVAYDAKTTAVIYDAFVTVRTAGLVLRDTINSYGNFYLLRDGLDSVAQVTIQAPGYRCLELANVRLGGELSLQVALQPRRR